jgi:hypothetical protein
VYIPYLKGVWEKFKHIGNHYNIRKIFKTKQTLRCSFLNARPERVPQQTAQCVYSSPCECGRSYIGETGRLLAVRLREYRQSQRGSCRKIKSSPTYLWRGSQSRME